METTSVRNAFGGLVEDVQVLTARRNELKIALHNVLAVVANDEVYLASAVQPGESVASCGVRLLREARAILLRAQ